MHASTLPLLALSLFFYSCSIEPAGAEMAMQAGITAAKTPVPVEGSGGGRIAGPTPCTAMTGAQLDFHIDTDNGTIVSVEAGVAVESRENTGTVTLYVTDTKNDEVPVFVNVAGSGKAALITDAAGTEIMLSKGDSTHTLSVPLGTTFTLSVTTRSSTQSDEDLATPNMPPTTKKAVIKPVPKCPG